MKIAFWSNYSDSGTTVDMLTVAAVMSLIYKVRITMISNHFGNKSLGYVVLGKEYDLLIKEGFKYYSKDNHFYLRKLLCPACDNPINGGTYDGIEDGLYYYFQEKMYCDSLNELNYGGSFNHLVSELETDTDYVFMDLQSQGSLNTLQMLEMADLVVVCLRQNETSINNFFKRYSSLTYKCIFLISDYDETGSFLKRDFVSKFHIHPERVAVIPHTPEFCSGVADGRIIPYIAGNVNCGKKHKQYRKMWYMRYAAEIVMKTLIYGVYSKDNMRLDHRNL